MELGHGVSGRPWRLREHDATLALALSQRLGLAEITGRLLAGRGVGLEDAAAFLAPRLREWLPDPSHLKDLDRAADRLAAAIAAGGPIGLIGDYDVDGATATALVARYLGDLGVTATIEIPDRLADGYGPSIGALNRLRASGCALVLTLDSGTTAFEALAHAAGLGLDVIVVDHHAAEESLPRAYAVVNPNRLDQESAITHLAAVGVAFMLLVAVSRRLREAGVAPPDLLSRLDLVALGTVCDVVPLTGLNRAFVAQGLKVARSAPNPGLAALARAARLDGIENGRHLGFVLGPRINAGGRTGRSALGARLLTTDCPSEAAGLAERLDQLNRERQTLERQVLAAAERAAAAQLAAELPALVVAGEDWHLGVVGIVAARLVERHHRPAFVLALRGGSASGSARSIPACDIGATVIAARHAGLAIKAGGHAMAAGITLEADRLDAFRAWLMNRLGSVPAIEPGRPEALDLDGVIATGAVQPALAAELARIAPFGPGNREPRFCLLDARPSEARPVGDGHLSCTLGDPSGARVRGIAFRSGGTALGAALQGEAPLRLAGRIKLDRWQGRERVCFEIEDAAGPAA